MLYAGFWQSLSSYIMLKLKYLRFVSNVALIKYDNCSVEGKMKRVKKKLNGIQINSLLSREK